MSQEHRVREAAQGHASGRVLTVSVRQPLLAKTTGKPRIGFVGHAFGGGGVERWLGALVSATRHEYQWIGVGCEEFCNDKASKMLGIPVSVGREECIRIAKQCDLLLVWCSDQLHRYAYESNAKLIGTWHSGPGSWTSGRAAMMDWDLLDAIHACSEYCVRSIPHAHRQRATVIFNSVDASWIRPTASKAEFLEANGVQHDGNIFSFIGRLSPEKGWGVAVAGASAAANSHVLVCGRTHTPSLDDGVRFAIEQMAPNSTFVGWAADVGNVLQCSSAIITPSSRIEACQYTVMEAALAGVPVISTPFGIVHDRPDVACQILPEAPTPDDITEACNRIASGGSDIDAKVAKARLLIASEFNMVVWRDKWLRFLASL